ncbi:MAG: hypothetical protein LBN05_05490 [Oscillospiraceae bacterium]|jgi:aspartokinase|nr:hypothetical protein [Oscillospiraceae bacterium]
MSTFNISARESVTVISLSDCPAGATFLAEVFGRFADSVNVDMIALTPGSSGCTAVSFTLDTEQFAPALATTGALQKEYPTLKVSVSTGYTKITVGSAAMEDAKGVAAQVFALVERVGADLRMVTTALTEISLLVPEADATVTIAALGVLKA